jgi:hypothetical protein
MKNYYAVSFGAPPALSNSDIEGVILTTITSDKTPSRDSIQKKLEARGFKGYLRMIRKDRFEKHYKNEGDYFYKK